MAVMRVGLEDKPGPQVGLVLCRVDRRGRVSDRPISLRPVSRLGSGSEAIGFPSRSRLQSGENGMAQQGRASHPTEDRHARLFRTSRIARTHVGSRPNVLEEVRVEQNQKALFTRTFEFESDAKISTVLLRACERHFFVSREESDGTSRTRSWRPVFRSPG